MAAGLGFVDGGVGLAQDLLDLPGPGLVLGVQVKDALEVADDVGTALPDSGERGVELANGLNPARHSEPGGRAHVGTEDVAQKYADYSVGKHEDYYIKFTFRRSEFEEHFGAGLKYEGGPGLEWEIPHAKIDLFNRLTIAKDKLWAPW